MISVEYQFGKKQLDRITHMEKICDRITAILASEENVYDCLIELEREIQELKEYYEGPAWKEDVDADRKGVFPKDLKRGILAEDTLYDLLGDVDQVISRNMDGQEKIKL